MSARVARAASVRRAVVAAVALGGGGAWYFMHNAAASVEQSIPASASESASASTTAARSAKNGADKGTASTVAVRTVTAVRKNVPVELQAVGTVVPINTVEIRPQTSSILLKVHVREGRFVRAGELLFTLDDRADRANLDKARAQLARDRATLADLERQHKRSGDLVAQNFISRGAVDSLQAQVEAQRALVASDMATVQAAEVAVGFGTIRAPISGRAGAIALHPGSLVQPATTLVSVTQIDPIEVGFSVPESSLHNLLDAQKAGRVAVYATLPNSGRSRTGTLSFIDNTVDPTAGTVRVKARFDNRDAALWPGQYANAQLTVATLENAIVIPAAAIVTGEGRRFVYSMEADGTAKPRGVELIHAFGTLAAVSGLAGGEKVVVEGKQNLRAGSRLADVQMDMQAAAGKSGRVQITGK